VVSTTGRHHWPGLLATRYKHIYDDDDADYVDEDDMTMITMMMMPMMIMMMTMTMMMMMMMMVMVMVMVMMNWQVAGVFVIEKVHFWRGPPESGFGASKWRNQARSSNVLK
jgi:hypothetical protein